MYEGGLAAVLASSATFGQPDPSLVILSYSFDLTGVQQAVLVGYPSGDGAVVCQSMADTWSCTECSGNKKTCKHVTAIIGDIMREKPAGLTDAEFSVRLMNFLTADRQSQKVTSISQVCFFLPCLKKASFAIAGESFDIF